MAKNCQSCGMPIKNDQEKMGTNANGTLNQDYCLYCYQQGEFTQPDFTAQEMQAFCIEKMREMGFPKPIAWLFTRGVPKLKRWSGK